MRQTVAIVATVRNLGVSLKSFIDYHHAIGFDHFFLFFDDPADSSIEEALRHRQVTAIRHNQKLRDEWKTTKLYSRLSGFMDTEVMARQQLNAEIAIRLALEKQIDWLLHIDGDELFYSAEQTVSEHFEALRESDIRRIKYLNYEAIPERANIGDYFKEATLFKINFLGASRKEFHERRKLIPNIPQLPESLFRFYISYKSAALVSQDLLPSGPHEFIVPEEQIVRVSTTSEATKTPGQTKPQMKRPVILHYPCCGFEQFWKKYVDLGQFDNKWYGSFDIAGIVPFHLEARDIVMQGDKQAAREFYEKQFVIQDESQISQLIASGLCCRISEPSQILTQNIPQSTRTIASIRK